MGVSGYIIAVLIMIVTSCASLSDVRQKSRRVEPVHSKILLMDPTLDQFIGLGPFEVVQRLDREVAIDLDNTIVIDHFGAKATDKLPIVVISHGNFSSRKAHRSQARHLASWGFHVVTCEFPNRDEWLENGRRLQKFSELIYRVPEILEKNADRNKLIVVGHSFGGSAALLAINNGAPVIGAILLDPAVVHKNVISSMKDIDLPVVLLGADRSIFTTRGRSRFWKGLSGEMIEVSVPFATHDDAQSPSMFSKSALGFDPFTSGERQKIFKAMLAASAIGISASGTLDFPNSVLSRYGVKGDLKEFKYREKNR